MNWEQIVYNFEQFWNKPIPIIGFTVGSVIIAILVIISKTSFGKKAIRKLTGMYNNLESGYEKAEEAFQEALRAKEELIAKKDEIIAEIEQKYNEKLALVQANRDKEKETIIAIAECINNVKIKKIVEEYKKLPEITDISEYIEDVKIKYDSKYEQVLAELEEVKQNYQKEIENKVQELKQEGESLKAEGENIITEAKEKGESIITKGQNIINEAVEQVEEIKDEITKEIEKAI